MMRPAIMTASYEGDFERCRLLCASIDRYVSGLSTHYLMVEARDVPLFRALEGPRRRVVSDADLLPAWLHPLDNPLPAGPRRVWLSRHGWPMRGWHVQQLRKLRLPAVVPEDIFLICDSDAVFVRPFDLASLKGPRGVRLLRRPGGITANMVRLGHVGWCRMSAGVLGLPPPVFPHDDFVDNLIVWDREHVLGLHERIRRVTGRDWLRELVRWRSFSEALLYGVYATRLTPEGIDPTDRPLSHTCWFGARMPEAEVRRFLDELQPDQVAVCLQSFIDIDPEVLWRLLDGPPDVSALAPAADR